MRGRIRDSKITIAILTPYRAQKDKVVDEIEKVLKTKKGKDVAVPSLFLCHLCFCTMPVGTMGLRQFLQSMKVKVSLCTECTCIHYAYWAITTRVHVGLLKLFICIATIMAKLLS